MRLLPAFLLAFVAFWTASGQTYTTSTFAGGALPLNIPGTAASLYSPQAIAVDQAGNVFFLDNNRVLRLDATTGVMTLAAGNGTAGYSGDNGPASSAQLNTTSTSSLAVDSAGNFYIADTLNRRIRRVSNGVITTVAGNGTASELVLPEGVAVDSAGNLYIADSGWELVLEVSNGVITTVAGGGCCGIAIVPGFSGDGGPATSAQ